MALSNYKSPLGKGSLCQETNQDGERWLESCDELQVYPGCYNLPAYHETALFQ